MPHIIPTIHPAALLHGGKPISDVILMDLAKANRVSMEGPNQVEYYVVAHPANPVGVEESVRIALQWMERWKQLKCPIAFDVETSSLDFFNCKLYSIALSGEDGCNTGVGFTLYNLRTLPWDAETALVYKLKELLTDPDIPNLFHNAPYDYAVLHHKNFVINGRIEDTQAYAHIVQPDIPKDLGWIGHTYLDVEPWKLNHRGEKQAFTQDVIELLIYNIKDAINTMKLRSPLLDEIEQRGMGGDLLTYQSAFAELASSMEIVGMPVNLAKRKAMGEVMAKEIKELEYRMRQWLNWPDFNPMSTNHVIEALYNRKYVGLVPTAFTKKEQKPSTSYKDIIDFMDHEFVSDFIKYKEMRTAYATQYKDPMPGEKGGSYFRALMPDGRIHSKINPTGQKGSRFSTSPNIQNQRKQDRAFFEAPEGKVIIGADKDQLELRIAACLAGVTELVAEMARPDGDPHTLAARNIYGAEFDLKPEKMRKKLRDAVKTTVYASLYRAGVKTVHKSIRTKKFLSADLRKSLTLAAVTHIYHSYFGKFVELPAWHDANYNLACSQGYIEIPPFGRRRFFPVQPPPMTEVGNWPIQTIGSDVVGMQMVHIQRELEANRSRWPDANIILHGHDAVYIECWARHAEEIIAKVVDPLFGHYYLEGPAGVVDLSSEAGIGSNLLNCQCPDM